MRMKMMMITTKMINNRSKERVRKKGFKKSKLKRKMKMRIVENKQGKRFKLKINWKYN